MIPCAGNWEVSSQLSAVMRVSRVEGERRRSRGRKGPPSFRVDPGLSPRKQRGSRSMLSVIKSASSFKHQQSIEAAIVKLILILPVLSIAFNGRAFAEMWPRSGPKVVSQENLQATMKQQGGHRTMVGTNFSDAASQFRCEDITTDGGGQTLSTEAAQVAELLTKYYLVPGRKSTTPPPPQQQQQQQQTQSSSQQTAKGDLSANKKGEESKPQLPRPLNVTVLIISWYPPILKLQWKLNELDESEATRLDFYHRTLDDQDNNSTGLTVNGSSDSQRPYRPSSLHQVDLEMAIGQQRANSKSQQQQEFKSHELLSPSEASLSSSNLLEELQMRTYLVDKSLSCFQVTYNIINSRFKVTEEYPPYLRSIMLERLLPATEYSLHVVAVYLGGRYRTYSDRVQFVSPTDNESRRFKENTYRPIHRYPDEKRELRIGLAQVRSEELTIVVIAVLFWIATICLFFNKWGKIRMLEPYQPAYRETSPSASFVAAHHHPSAHNLGLGATNNSVGGTGSCGTGSGPLTAAAAAASNLVVNPNKMSSFCAGVPGLVGVTPAGSGSETAAMVMGASAAVAAAASATAAATQGDANSPPVASGTVLAAASTLVQPAAAAAEVPGLKCPGGRNSDGALVATGGAGRKASRSLLLLGNRRFESLASAGDTPLRRTDTELNYLFQSKALALAKATSLWSRQQQKLRHFQYRTHMPLSMQHAQPQLPVHAPDQQLDMLRRTSQALLRQRNPPLSSVHYGLQTAAPPPIAAVQQLQFAATMIQATGTAVHHQLASSGIQQQHQQELLQQQQSTQRSPLVGQPLFANPRPQHTMGAGHRKTSEGNDAINQAGRATPTRSDIWHGGRGSSVTSRGQLIRHAGQQTNEPGGPRVGTKSLDWNDEVSSVAHREEAEGEEGKAATSGANRSTNQQRQAIIDEHAELQASSSNKMRRLLFITKSHQHHHIATSSSATQLPKWNNSISLPNNLITNNAKNVTSSSTSKINNSFSLDNAEDHCANQRQEPQEQHQHRSQPEGGSSSSLPAQVRQELQQASHQMVRSRSRDDRPPPANRPPMIRMMGEPGEAGHRPSLVEHHILIEPPSPPMQRDLLEAGESLDQEHRQQQTEEASFACEQAKGTQGFFDDSDQNNQVVGGPKQLFQQLTSVAPNRGRPLGMDNKSPPGVGGQQLQLNAARCCRQGSETDSMIQKLRGSGRLHDDTLGEWPKSDKHSTATIVTANESGTQLADGGTGTHRGLNYSTIGEPDPRRSGPTTLSGSSSASNILTTSQMEQQPEICLETPAEEEGELRRASYCSGGGSTNRPSNEPFAKLASYQAAQNSAGIRRKLASLGTSGQPAGSFSQQRHSAAGAPNWGSQLSHGTTATIEQPPSHHLRHQSFCSDCRRSPQSSSGEGEQVGTRGGLEGGSHEPMGGGGWTMGAQGELVGSGISASDLDQHGGDFNHNNQTNALMMYAGQQSLRPRVSSVFVASPYSRAHRDSFAMLRALSQKKSKSAEDVAYLSSLVVQIWVRDRNPLLQSVSQQQLSTSCRRLGGSQERQTGVSQMTRRHRPKSSLTVAHI